MSRRCFGVVDYGFVVVSIYTARCHRITPLLPDRSLDSSHHQHPLVSTSTMETLEIHSKSFLIKWVEVPSGSAIIWQLRPKKKSINFGVFRHAGGAEMAISQELSAQRRSSVALSNQSMEERLVSNGLEKIFWHGKCPSNEMLRGHYDAKTGGMFALVFDNTFSKTTAKTVLFSHKVAFSGSDDVLPWHGSSSQLNSASPSSAVLAGPDSSATSAGAAGASAAALPSSSTVASSSAFATSSTSVNTTGHVVSTEPIHQGSKSVNLPTAVSDGRYISGIVLKKRRKKLQGYARRYFSLDYKYGVLNYYLDEKSSLLRGSMPIKFCVVSVISHSRDIIIDSGAEIWTLRALNDADLKTWSSALDVARHSNTAPKIGYEHRDKNDYLDNNGEGVFPVKSTRRSNTINLDETISTAFNPKTEKLASLIQELDHTRALISGSFSPPKIMVNQDYNISQLSLSDHNSSTADSPVLQPPPIPNEPSSIDPRTSGRQRRPSLWRKRKNSTNSPNSEPTDSLGRKASTTSVRNISTSSSQSVPPKPTVREAIASLDNLVERFRVLLREVEASDLVSAKAKNVADAEQSSLFSGNEEFYDAMEEFEDGVLYLDDGDIDVNSDGASTASDSDDSLSEDDDAPVNTAHKHRAHVSVLVDSSMDLGEHDLYPLPLAPVDRRVVVQAPAATPPSLLGFLRKNVGKDMTSIAMPVTANEPLTILQRYSEFFEYSDLLNEAANAGNPEEALLLVSAFAVSAVSNQRVKERCQRKPFNPLLGETFELVREDLGFRLIAEKISHRPPIMAYQVESADWVIHLAAMPNQKFWGKSMEINDSGLMRITFKQSGAVYEFIQPSSFIRNLIAGEKYVEPHGSVTVDCSNGLSSQISYLKAKSGGMFASHRSEEVNIKLFDKNGHPSDIQAHGNWTEELKMLKDGAEVRTLWKVGKLAQSTGKKGYGFTEYGASLNEITCIEEEQIAPTDSRLRPDQRTYENGNIDEAERLKLELEERQRRRRKVLEESGDVHEPAFFEERSSDSGTKFYVLKEGAQNYWERRKNKQWEGVLNLWEDD